MKSGGYGSGLRRDDGVEACLHRRQHPVAAIIRIELSAALPSIAAQRAAGEAFLGTLNEQARPRRCGLPPAAKAALETLTQTAAPAATISMVTLMARSFQKGVPSPASQAPIISAMALPRR